MNASHKILVTGTLRSGKTTLLREFMKQPQFVVVREVAQDIIDQYGYKITQTPEFQDIVFAEQLKREYEAEHFGKPFILCDRGTIDIVAFCNIIGHPVKSEWMAGIYDRYESAVVLNKDDIIFDTAEYEGEVGFDMRLYRDRVDQSIREVLSQIALPTFEIRGPHIERLKMFSEYIQPPSGKEGNIRTIENLV